MELYKNNETEIYNLKQLYTLKPESYTNKETHQPANESGT